jgi:hypothetical protein
MSNFIQTTPRSRAALLVCLTAFVFTVSLIEGSGQSVATAPPSPPGAIKTSTAETSETLANQIAIEPWMDAMTDMFGPFTREDGSEEWASGYAEMYSHPAAKSVDIYWAGEIPRLLDEMLDRVPDGFNAQVVKADFDMNALSAAASRVVQTSLADPSATAGVISRVAPAEDRSGLNVFMSNESTSKFEPSNVERMIAIVERLSDLPVVDVFWEDPVTPTGSRNDDASPWRGGALTAYQNWYCTTGVGVTRDDTGDEFLLTARHCALNPGMTDYGSADSVVDFAGDALGEWRSGWGKPTTDTIRVRPYSANVQSRIYVGAPGSTATLPVHGTNGSIQGNFVCQSGANTGQRCDLEIEIPGQAVPVLGTALVGARFAHRVSGVTQAVKGGDSGGPVYALTSGGEAQIKGIISAGRGDTECYNQLHPVGGDCHATLVYVQLNSALAAQGSSLKVQ